MAHPDGGAPSDDEPAPTQSVTRGPWHGYRRCTRGTGRTLTRSRRTASLLIGPFPDPVRDGAMAVFTSRAAAERFRDGDPFVLEGLVARTRILDRDPIDYRSAG